MTGFETNNKYVVKNSVGQDVFYAAENSSCCARLWCGNIRNFEMTILDNFGEEVIHISRPLACQGCCCPCCLQVFWLNGSNQIFNGDYSLLFLTANCHFFSAWKRDRNYRTKMGLYWSTSIRRQRRFR